MNKHTVITAVAIAVIAIPLIYSGSSIVEAQQLEYRWDSPGEFTFFTMSNDGKMEFCNTLPFWTSFQKFEIKAFYQSKHLGSFAVGPMEMNPLSSTVQEGAFSSEELPAAQHIFMTFDFEFNGGNIRLDPTKFVIVTSMDTPILGIIPYSTTSQISGYEFDKMMNAENLSCD